MPMTRFFQTSRAFRTLFLIGIVSLGMTGLCLAVEEERQPPSDTAPAEDEAPVESEESGQPETAAEPSTSSPAAVSEVNPSITLKGRVWRAKPGIVFLRTPIGLLSLSSKTTLKTLPASQEVSFWVHENHFAIDIVKRTDGMLVHRYLSGPFKRSDEDEKRLLWWTPDGEKAFHVGSHERAFATRKEGDPVTVEVDETNTVIGVHDLQFDLQIGQIGASGSGAHVLLTGTVSKLKSNFIFFRTPIGIINVNANIGIKNPKVGQTMTLHMHDHHVVTDLSAPSDPAPVRRFVTGPLEFAAPDRTSIRLWTPSGEQTFPTDPGKTALDGLREGTPITVELDAHGSVVEFHRLK
ncbi:MAG: hypothetical protein NDI90_01275 [Nitrospira sp. BO4]|jgi:hypothetical protein|nr:hypothetical protein [Nitrospira sp. BO4]